MIQGALLCAPFFFLADKINLFKSMLLRIIEPQIKYLTKSHRVKNQIINFS